MEEVIIEIAALSTGSKGLPPEAKAWLALSSFLDAALEYPEDADLLRVQYNLGQYFPPPLPQADLFSGIGGMSPDSWLKVCALIVLKSTNIRLRPFLGMVPPGLKDEAEAIAEISELVQPETYWDLLGRNLQGSDKQLRVTSAACFFCLVQSFGNPPGSFRLLLNKLDLSEIEFPTGLILAASMRRIGWRFGSDYTGDSSKNQLFQELLDQYPFIGV